MVGRENLIGSHLVYTITYDREMNNVIEFSAEEPFAKGQNSRDLRVCYDAGDVETQFMDTIDSAYDFFRFLHVSTRGIANIERTLFKKNHENSFNHRGNRLDRQERYEEAAGAKHTGKSFGS
jgi:hypothetical protein